MPKFRVPILQDAFIHHEAIVEADTKEEAAQTVYDAWRHGSDTIVFEEGDATGFDDIVDPRDDLEEIEEVPDEEGSGS